MNWVYVKFILLVRATGYVLPTILEMFHLQFAVMFAVRNAHPNFQVGIHVKPAQCQNNKLLTFKKPAEFLQAFIIYPI